MAAKYGSLNVTLEDYKGKTGNVKMRVPIAKATEPIAKKLADFLKEHSDARVVSYGISKEYAGDSTDSGKYDRCLQRLLFLFEDQDGVSHTFSFPAPRDEDVNDDQEPTSGLAEDIKDLLTGGSKLGIYSSIVYNGGGITSRLPRKGARSTKMTGV
jgi:hypothetical protein